MPFSLEFITTLNVYNTKHGTTLYDIWNYFLIFNINIQFIESNIFDWKMPVYKSFAILFTLLIKIKYKVNSLTKKTHIL